MARSTLSRHWLEACAVALSIAGVSACTFDFDQFRGNPGSGDSGGSGHSGGSGDSGGSSGAGVGGGAGASGVGGSAGTAIGGTAGRGGSGGSGGLTSGGSGGAGGAAGVGGGAGTTGFDCDQVAGTLWNGHCYFEIGRGTGLTWERARDACAALSPTTHLVTITSAEEEAAVEASVAPFINDFWIGLALDDITTDPPPGSCKQDAGSCPFHWVTGEELTYTDWGQHSASDVEPNYSGACVRILFDLVKWGDYLCSGGAQQIPAICENDG